MIWKAALKWFLVSFAIATALAILSLVALFNFLSTEPVAKTLASELGKAQEAQISWQVFEGDLLSNFEMQGFRYITEDLEIEADRIRIIWDFASLLQKQVLIESLDIQNLRVSSLTTDQSATDQTATDANQSPRLWPSLDLPVSVLVRQAEVSQILLISGQQQTSIDSIELAGGFHDSLVNLENLVIQSSGLALQTQGSLSTTPPYDSTFELSWQLDQLWRGMDFAGIADLSGDLLSLRVSNQLNAPATLSSEVNLRTGLDPEEFGFALDNLSFEQSHNWPNQVIPLAELPREIFSAGDIRIDGTPAQINLGGDLDIEVPTLGTIGQVGLQFQAQIIDQNMALENLSLSHIAGDLSSSGELGWTEQLQWNMNLRSPEVRLAEFFPDWPAVFSANLQTTGALTESGIQASTMIEELEGNLHSYPVRVEGEISYIDGLIAAQNLIIEQSQNRMELSAQLSEEVSVNWHLEIPDISQLYPSSGGAVSSTGSVSGSRNQPVLEGYVEARALEFGAAQLESLQVNLGNLSNSEARVNIQAEGLVYPGVEEVDLAVQLLGGLDRQQFEVLAAQSNRELSFRGFGSLVEESWSAGLTELELLDINLGQWTLESEVQINANTSDILVSPLCLQNNPSRFCVQGRYQLTRDFELAANSSNLELSLFKPLYSQRVELEGNISGALNLTSLAGEQRGFVQVDSDLLNLIHQSPDGPQVHNFSDLSASGQINGPRVAFDFSSILGNLGSLSGDIDFPFRGDSEEISGQISAQIEQLSWLDPFIPSISDLNGTLQTELRIGGNLSEPVLEGDLDFSDIQAYLPELGIDLSEGQLSLQNTAPGRWLVEGRLRSGEGDAQVNGELEFQAIDRWSGTLNLTGEEFTAYARLTNQLVVSPQIEVQFDPELVRVNGRLVVPSANWELTGLPSSAIQVSEDEIIIGASDTPFRDQRSIAYQIDLIVELADEVSFTGFQIESGLNGQVRFRESPEQSLRLDGNLQLIEGTYNLYGQTLDIDPGELIFSGSPSNPQLNLRATRQIGEDLVGVQIGGTPRRLSSTLFSEPTLSSTEILAMLVTGRPFAESSNVEGQLLLTAISNLGIQHSAPVTQRIQSTLGLDVLELNTGQNIEESFITMGKYLSPRIFISYAKDILTPESSFHLDYTLYRNFLLKAQSGSEQSVDLLYRFER